MKAISEHQGQLAWIEQPDLSAQAGELIIDVHATAINRADLLQKKGLYPVPPGASPILGLECAGMVAELGEGAQGFAVGDRVCALLAGGGYAERVAVPAGQVLPLPAGLDFTQGAAIPEVFATAYLNLYQLGRLSPGETVLLHAGASGVGTAAIQLCRALGNPCFVTVGSDEKIQSCVQLGADGGVNRKSAGFKDAVAQWSGGRGVDVILDPVGAAYLSDNLASLAEDGRLILIGLMSGVKAEINLAQLLPKRLQLIGSTLRALSVERKTAILRALQRHIWPLLENGEIRPIIETSIPIEQVEQAHELLASNTTVGKIILQVKPG